ncbi:hypothetical protein LLG95_10175 [bacterium]|nr:hypothetical protein [bacterium]
MNPRDESRIDKPAQRPQWWAIGLIATGLLCAAVPLAIYFVKYLTRQTVTDRLLLIDYHECPTIMLGVVLVYLGIVKTKRRSALWFAGVVSFFLVAIPTVLISAMSLITTACCIFFMVLTLIGRPRGKAFHYAFPFIALFFGAIGTPNIEWASIRGDVGATRNEMHYYASILDKYHADHHAYPPSTSNPVLRADWDSTSQMPGFAAYTPGGPPTLTTPVTYLEHYYNDDFRFLDETRTYAYHRWDENSCILIGAGPNCVFDIKPEDLPRLKPANGISPPEFTILLYDPTNGTVSAGDIVKVVSQ